MNHKVITSGMVFTSACSSIGLVAFCFVGLVATELILIPQSARLAAVLIGGAAVAIGAEGGSLFAFVAAFERDGKLRGWDIVGALFSQAATLSTVIFAFRALSGSGSSPLGFVVNTVAVSMDATFNYVALGLHLRNGRALALAEKQAALDYHRQVAEIERQRALLRNNNETGAQQLRNQVEELRASLQDVNQENARLEAQLRNQAQPTATGSATEAQPRIIQLLGATEAKPAQPTGAANETASETGATKAQLVAQLLRENGRTVAQIAQLAGCSAQYVRKVRGTL